MAKAKKLKVNMISETEFTVQGHGVHTAYLETVRALEKFPEKIDLAVNVKRPADIIHVQTMGFYALGKMCRFRGKKVISAHLLPASFIGSLALAKIWAPFAKWYLTWFYNRADLVFAVSETTKSELQKIGVKKPIAVLYNSIDTRVYKNSRKDKKSRQEIRAKLGIRPDDFVVICAGQTQPRKRVDTFINVAKKSPKCQFVWVGGMPFGRLAANYSDTKKMTENVPANVHFAGIVKLDEMPKFYAAADAFFLPSDQETFGLVVVEAAAAGLPVVLRDIADYDGTFRSGALFGKTDADFAKIIEKLAKDAKYYEAAHKKAHKIAARFESENFAKKLIQHYEDLLKQK